MSFPYPVDEIGTLSPEALTIVEGICSAITAERWFASGPERHREFASYVRETYQRGLVPPDELHKYCRLAAQTHFARIVFRDDGEWRGGRYLQ
jgi:hypothetical protein